VIHFLCISSRPNWRPFLEKQWEKLASGNKLTVYENSARRIGEVRQQLLDESDPSAEWVAFIDDDDWQNPLRRVAVSSEADVVGSRVGYKVDPLRGRAQPYTTTELCIFNGAVVRRELAIRCRFPPVDRCEDTAWMAQIATYMTRGALIVPQHLSAWMCHGQNVANKASQLTFESPAPSYLSRQELQLASSCALPSPC
jgi:hypothetical protein